MRRLSSITALILLAFLSAGLCTGCLDSKDINDKIIATTIAVDYRDGEYWFYVEYANIEASNSGETNGGSADKYILRKSHGKTLIEARYNLNIQLDQQLYLSGVRTLIITEAFAKQDIVEYLYRLRADENYRKKVITIITRDDIEVLFSTIISQNKSVGYCIEETIKKLDETGESFSRMTSRIIENLSAPYTGILISCIGLQDNETALVGYSVVNDTRVVGFIPVEESKGLNILKADKARTFYIVPYRDISFTIETNMIKRRIGVSYKDGLISYPMSFEFEATLLYGDKKVPYDFDEEANREVTEILRHMIEEDLMTALDQAQTEFRTDYLQLDDTFRIKYPTVFEEMDWNEAFAKAEFALDVSVALGSTMMDYSPSDVQ